MPRRIATILQFPEKLPYRIREASRVIEVDNVSAIEYCQARVRPARGHLLDRSVSRHSAVASANQQGWTLGGEPIRPVITGEASPGRYDLTWIKRDAPSGRGLPERVLDVWQQSRPNTLCERLARGKLPLPGEHEAEVIRNLGANVLDDETTDLFWMPRGELVRVDPTERVAQENHIAQTQVLKEGLQIANVVVAAVAQCVIGVSVSTLVERHDPPFGGQRRGQRRKSYRLHEVRVQGDEYATDTTRIKIGELHSVMVKVVPFHVRRISHLLSGPQNTEYTDKIIHYPCEQTYKKRVALDLGASMATGGLAA